MLDLHLFLGRPILNKPTDPSKIDDGVYGRLPQSILDVECEETNKAIREDQYLVNIFAYV
jgi:hypothetical protein